MLFARLQKMISSLDVRKKIKRQFFSPNFPVDLPNKRVETPHVPQETPHEPQETNKVPQEVVHVHHSGEIFAKSRAAFLAANLVRALRSIADLFHTLTACCATKVSTPLRGTMILPVLAEPVFLPVLLLLLSNKIAPT
jgi:hypothetical protein